MTIAQKMYRGERRSILQGIKWETYQALASDLSENACQKLTYDEGRLEIMTPLPEHEVNKRFLGRIVETTTEVLGLEICSLGSTTWSREDLQRGIEPDESYYITNESLIRGKLDFDLNIDPAPDLAIEVDITSSSLDRLKIYASLGIGEVWRFNGEDLLIYVLQEEVYQIQERSKVLPVLTKSELLKLLQRRGEMGENALLRELRQWLQSQQNYQD
jgi:Uma2 family endonuclease